MVTVTARASFPCCKPRAPPSSALIDITCADRDAKWTAVSALRFPALTRLKVIATYGFPFGELVANHSNQLTSLTIRSLFGFITAKPPTCTFPRLTHLSLNDTYCRAWPALLASPSLNSINALYCSPDRIDPNLLASISDRISAGSSHFTSHCTRLAHVDLRGMELSTLQPPLWDSLRVLHIHGLTDLSQLNGLKRVVFLELTLGRYQETRGQVNLPSLRCLSLCGIRLMTRSDTAATFMAGCPALTSLLIEVTKADAKSLSRLEAILSDAEARGLWRVGLLVFNAPPGYRRECAWTSRKSRWLEVCAVPAREMQWLFHGLEPP